MVQFQNRKQKVNCPDKVRENTPKFQLKISVIFQSQSVDEHDTEVIKLTTVLMKLQRRQIKELAKRISTMYSKLTIDLMIGRRNIQIQIKSNETESITR